MSIYRYTLSDYHAIKEADITIDGITVLAGENGCGKSTLSRWLYYLVNGAQRFEESRIDIYSREIDQMILDQNPVIKEMRHSVNKQKQGQIQIPFTIPQRTKSFPSNNHETTIQYFQDKFKGFVYNTSELIKKYLANTSQDKKNKRIVRFLGLDYYEEEMDNPELIVEQYIARNLRWLERRISKLYADLERRSLKIFLDDIRLLFQEYDDIPKHLQLWEDEVELICKDRVSTLFNLRRAIYIDTPMALTNESSKNMFWDELKTLVSERSKHIFDNNELILLRRITNILHGKAEITKNDFNDDELHFVSDDGKINIEIDKAATGFKTFIYLQRLLENGYLGSDSLLLIDEPEAHLHPQWIVEYARILVLLNKELGQKIMLATHNPDMVAAIRSIAEKEQVLNNTNFYISEPSGQSNTYCYKALGTDISEIFTSFNIALDRIQAYGTDNL